MKRHLLTTLLLTACAAAFFATTEATASEKSRSAADERAAAQTRKRLVSRMESCEAILQEIMANPKTAIPRSILSQAKGLVIVNEFQAGIGIGAKGGYGIVLVRRNDGSWSIPCFLSAGEASLGLQLGANSLNTVYVLMDEAGARLLFESRFNFGAQAHLVGGPSQASAQESTQIIKASVYAYTKSEGLYAGAKLKSGWLAPNNKANRHFYQTEYSMPELLYSAWVAAPAEAQPLINYVSRLASN